MSQIMKLSYFPQVKVVHTSKVFHGQLYVPFLNWIMMVATVLVAAIFNNVRTTLLPAQNFAKITLDHVPWKCIRVRSPG